MSRTVIYPIAIHKTGKRKADQLAGRLKDKTIKGAKYLAPRGSHKHGSGTPVKGRRLADSWKVEEFYSGSRKKITITNTANYADVVARGSQPHRIPKRGFKKLRFSDWPRGQASPNLRKRFPSGEFFFKSVHHPGNKRPVRYLQTPLAMYGRQAGFKVRITPGARSRLP